MNPTEPNAAPQFYGVVNGLFVPTIEIEVTQSSYGVADEITFTTPLNMADVDYGNLSQQVPGAPVQVIGGFGATQGTTAQPLIQGVLESLSNDYDKDVITIRARGILANLVDARVSARVDMNSTITTVITNLINKYGLKAQVSPSSIKVGTVLNTDYVAVSRNMRALDFIHLLCRTAGWTTRTVGALVVVGPPPDTGTAPLMTLNWAAGDLLSLHVEHNALHNKNIKVKVVSYIQSTKQRGVANSATPLANSIGIPNTQGTTAKPTPRPVSGRQSGFTSVGERDNVQEYVIPVPNKSQQECNDLALVYSEEIAKHEFTADMKIAVGSELYSAIVAHSPDFNIQLAGCDQPSNNGLYYPSELKWSWSAEAANGLELEITALNHPLPAPTGGA